MLARTLAMIVLGALSAFCLIAGFWPDAILMSFVLWVVRVALIINGCVFVCWTFAYVIWATGKPVDPNTLLHRDDPSRADDELECNGGWVGPEGARRYEKNFKDAVDHLNNKVVK